MSRNGNTVEASHSWILNKPKTNMNVTQEELSKVIKTAKTQMLIQPGSIMQRSETYLNWFQAVNFGIQKMQLTQTCTNQNSVAA